MNTQKEVEYMAEIASLKSDLGMLKGNKGVTLDLINKLLALHHESNEVCRYRVKSGYEDVLQGLDGRKKVCSYPPEIYAEKTTIID